MVTINERIDQDILMVCCYLGISYPKDSILWKFEEHASISVFSMSLLHDKLSLINSDFELFDWSL